MATVARAYVPAIARATAPHVAGSFYRPELDLLRFGAFFLVFLHHSLPRGGQIGHLGPLFGASIAALDNAFGFGLCLFFALSAYLITELLVRERKTNGKVQIKAFYLRRALRIWPLYFLALAIGMIYILLTPGSGDVVRFGAYVILAGNWYCVAHGAVSTPMDILWSISVEEQFYLFWPWVVAARTKWVLGTATGCLAVCSAVALLFFGHTGVSTDAIWFNSFVQFGMFGAGAAVSLVLRGRSLQWRVVTRVSAATAALLLWWSASFLFHIKDTSVTPPVTMLLAGYAAVAMGCVLLLLAVMGISADHLPGALIYLGRISFGLYVFHEWARTLAFRIVPSKGIVHPLLALAITIGLASLSFRFFETPFLKLKKRLEVVRSRSV